MKIHVNAGFGEKLHSKVAEACQSVAHGIRTSIAVNDEHPMIAELVEDALLYFKESTFIIGGWNWRENGKIVEKRHENLLPLATHLGNQCESLIAEWLHNGGDDQNLWIEIGNELDLSYWEKHLQEFYELACHLYERIRSVSTEAKIITGSTSNLALEPFWKYGAGYECFERLTRYPWPKDTYQGLHPYGSYGYLGNHLDDKLDFMLSDRKLAITEFGFKGNPLTGEAWMGEQLEKWKSFGAVCFDPYQIQDAALPDNKGEGSFGLFTNLEDGLDPKPVASVFLKEMKA